MRHVCSLAAESLIYTQNLFFFHQILQMVDNVIQLQTPEAIEAFLLSEKIAYTYGH